ncbi:hypothetical protein Pan181_13890 [Aeoliella mucimassa]|uniref:Uncharacterized protein n=1 Tax=Aeoliella mucimassa TaxID=2527972 RepID=A0A518AKF9_9BACT|nr:hypothetical protein Pan181_13890 [Aeoliella mucimassa]
MPVVSKADESPVRRSECGTHLDCTVPEDSLRLPNAALRDSTWLPAALLATLVLLASALQAFGEEPAPLQWRPARAIKPNQSTEVQKPRGESGWATTADVQPATGAKQTQSNESGRVIQVTYRESSGPQLITQGEARVSGVVVHPRDPRFRGTGPAYRLSQDPFADDTDLDAELNRQIAEPFGDPDQQAPTLDGPAPGLEPGELPEPLQPGGLNEGGLEMTPPDGFDMPEDDFDALDNGVAQPGVDPTFQDPTQQPNLDSEAAISSPRAREKFDEERRKATEAYDEALTDLRSDRIGRIQLGISLTGREGLDYPFEGTIDDGTLYEGREWPEVTYMWKAAANCHKPLYFEQPQLERYGHSWGPYTQPLISGAHFFTRIPVLPYCMGIESPTECIYPLGHYRPGNCAPYMIPAVPFTWRAALFEAGAVTGAAAAIP